MPDAEDQPKRPKTEHAAPTREQSGSARTTLLGAAKFVGGSVGCLVFLAIAALMAVAVLAIFLDDPVFWIAVVALLVALSARKAAKGRTGKR